MSSDSDSPYERERRPAKQINLNSVLLAVVLGISAWSLREQVKQGQDFSRMEERLSTQVRDVTDLRVRLSAIEVEMTALQIKMAAQDRRP